LKVHGFILLVGLIHSCACFTFSAAPVQWSIFWAAIRRRATHTYMAAEGAGGRGRAMRYPPLSALVVSAIAAFSAVIVLAVVHSVQDLSG
jgi:hypothetical protein